MPDGNLPPSPNGGLRGDEANLSPFALPPRGEKGEMSERQRGSVNKCMENKKKVIAEVIRFIITVLGALLGTSALQSCGLL